MKAKIVTISKKLFAAATISIFLWGCSSESSFEKENGQGFIIDLSGESIQAEKQSLVIDENNPANFYCRIDSVVGYGYGIVQYFPDSLKNSVLKISFSGKMRDSESMMGYIAFALHNQKDSMVFYATLPSNRLLKEPNAWTVFTDSVIVPQDKNTFDAKYFKIFPGKQFGKGYFDVDDLKIKVTKE